MPSQLLTVLLGFSIAIFGVLIAAKRSYALQFRQNDQTFAGQMNMYKVQKSQAAQAYLENAKQASAASESYRDLTLFLNFSLEFSALTTALLLTSFLIGEFVDTSSYIPLAMSGCLWFLLLLGLMIRYRVMFSLDQGTFRSFSIWYMNASWRLCLLPSPLRPLTNHTDLARWSWLRPLIMDEPELVKL